MAKRQSDFKAQLQELEENMWSSINFSKEFVPGVKLNTSLTQSMEFQGDYILATLQNEFDTYVDLSDFESHLKVAVPSFSNENQFRKDL